MFTHIARRAFTTSTATSSTGGIAYKGIERWGIRSKRVQYNLSVPDLYISGLRGVSPADYDTQNTTLASSGALVAYSGVKTGRSPGDKRVVKDDNTKDEIWWGKVNIPISPETNDFCRDLAVKYLNNKEKIYVQDGYVGWDPDYRLKVRIICSRAYHALFMKNMLIRPTREELARDFADDTKIDFHVFNAGEFTAPKPIAGLTSGTSIQCNFSNNTYTILGTQYAGEMKKGLFGVMHYYMPKKHVLSLHASATEGEKGDVTLLFGLSGTGKTTLSADPKRRMLGDDEHCWSPNGVFNIEGGCYAKCVNLSAKNEPEIFNAIKFGALMENVLFEKPEDDRVVDFKNIRITENTRVSYPLEHIPNAKFPSMGGHAKNIIFLTADAFGVLPPISRLNSAQAMYHFISGYTAKVAGTEVGVKEPQPTFSAAFGEVFLPLHPTIYADMLAEKMKTYGSQAWLVNTGWTGGKYGVGRRMDLPTTRKIIDCIHDGSAMKAEYTKFPGFGFEIPTALPGVDSKLLNPRNTWANKEEYDDTLKKLANEFNKNFKNYADRASPEIRSADPKF